jgi:hypothetical protein
MKIGLSYSRCVRDIFDGIVDLEDVLVIIARTNFDPKVDDEWLNIWNGYHSGQSLAAPEWADYAESDQERFRALTIDLYESGKLHQPRQFGRNPVRLPYHWLETVLPDEQLNKYPAVWDAWKQFQIVAGLSGVTLRKH